MNGASVNEKKLQVGPKGLGFKIRQREGPPPPPPPPTEQKLTYFSNHEEKFSLNKIWYEVR